MTAKSVARGFGVVELLVSVGLVLVGMALASNLLLRAQVLGNQSVAAFQDSQPRLAGARLRGDLQDGWVVSRWLPGWRSEGLVLRRSDGARIIWRLEDDLLRRDQVDNSGNVIAGQVVLRGAAAWRWRRPVPELLDVEISLPVTEQGSGVVLAGPRSLRAKEVVTIQAIRIAARRGPGW